MEVGVTASIPMTQTNSDKVCKSQLWGKVLCLEDDSWFNFERGIWFLNPFHYIVLISSPLITLYRIIPSPTTISCMNEGL